MKLYRLIYSSDQCEHLNFAELKDILLKSEHNNAKQGITGLLVMLDNRFLQVLEGPGIEVNALYQKIARDSRHKNIRLISYTQIHQRHFNEWSMKGIVWSAMKPKLMAWLITKYGESDGTVTIPEDPWMAYSLLYDIYCSMHLAEWMEESNPLENVVQLPEKTVINYERYRVLVVEDDAVVRRIILRMLQQMGFVYLGEADEGNSALQETEKLPPDLILCDIEMKPMDGLSFLKILRDKQGVSCPKFIFLTGQTDLGTVSRAYELGVDSFISKPVRFDQLRRQINGVIG